MLIQGHRVDENGFYLESVLIEQNDVVEDENIVTVDPPEGLFLPRWLNGEWTEGLTPEEIAERMKPVPSPVDPMQKQIDGLKIQNANLLLKSASLQTENGSLKQQNANMMLILARNGLK